MIFNTDNQKYSDSAKDFFIKFVNIELKCYLCHVVFKNLIMEYQWFEEQPSSCPPFDSVECNGPYFRVSYGNPAESEDFFSQKRLAPNKVFKGEGIDDCIVRAVSVFSLLEDAKRLLKLPKFKHANIAEVSLRTMDGKIKKTFKNSHYSWWRSKAFDIKKAKTIEL